MLPTRSRFAFAAAFAVVALVAAKQNPIRYTEGRRCRVVRGGSYRAPWNWQERR